MFCVFLHFFRSVLEIKLFRLLMAVNATLMDDLLPMKSLFQSNIPSIDLVSNQIYHRIDGILLASVQSMLSARWLWRISLGNGASQKRRNIFNE